MESVIFSGASGLALCALLSVPAAAQQVNLPSAPGPAVSSEHQDASGMTINRSTPQEQAQTSGLNNQESTRTGQINGQAATADSQYQEQQKEYQEQLRQNQKAQADYQDRKAAYDAQTARYESLRARFAAQRSQYHRDLWPEDYRRPWDLQPDTRLMHARAEITNGDHVGTVTGIARDAFGRVEGLELSLDDGKRVWIDASDARFNRADGILMTDLTHDDLGEMADERL